MKTINAQTVVFVTGAFVSHRGWDEWKKYFESKGYKTLAPSHPNKDAPPATLRHRHPDAAIASNRLAGIVEHYTNIIKALPEKPIVIGHSLGGLITQILVNRDLAAAGIAIHSVPPRGVFPYEFSFLKAGWRALGIFTSVKKSYLMSFKTWQYAFTNGMTLEDQQKAYEVSTIPESKLAARDGLTKAAAVDFKKSHVPLLLISGSEDNIIPASLNLRNFKAYKTPDSITELKEVRGNNHYVVNLPNWKETADSILTWIESVDNRQLTTSH
ncbi:MAG TPA: alpha/beta hydrolase [Ohtaekwangia sp.]